MQFDEGALRQAVNDALERADCVDRLPRVEELLQNCPRLTFDICNLTIHACEQGAEKLDEVLELLEKHYAEHLYYQHPEVRGTVCDMLLGGVNKTQAELLRICTEVLHLQPST